MKFWKLVALFIVMVLIAVVLFSEELKIRIISGVNIREAGAGTATVVGVAKKGEEYVILDIISDDIFVKSAGLEGWVYSGMTKNVMGKLIVTKDCTIWSAPKFDAQRVRVGSLKQGDEVVLKEMIPAWYKIGERKWVCANKELVELKSEVKK